MGRQLIYWLFLGVIGLAVFFVLHSKIAFNAGAPIQLSKSAIEQQTASIAQQLGFSTDSLQMMTKRSQHLNYYKTLKDSADSSLQSTADLNRSGIHLTGWEVNLGTAQDEGDGYSRESNDFLSTLGRLGIRYDQQGNVRRISSYNGNPNPTFVSGDSLFAIANRIVRDVLGYNLQNYRLDYVDVRDTVFTSEPVSKQQPLELSQTRVGNNMVFNWVKSNVSADGPHTMSLEVKPIIRENNTPNMANIRYGVAVEEFKAMDQYEPEALDTPESISTIDLATTFGSLAFLAIIVVFFGIKYINKGQVEWRRALFILVTITLGILGWRVLYLMNTMSGFWNQTSEALFILNNLIFAAILGLYGALAYIGWEAMARNRNEQQLHLLDAYWRKRFFFRETGEGLLRGYAIGGMLLGIFAVALYLAGTVYYQYDSQFGFTEAGMTPKLLTINLAIWVNTCLVVLGHIAVSTGFLQSKINNRWIYYGSGILLLGFLFSGSGMLFELVGAEWYDLIVYTALAVIVLLTFHNSGLVSFAAGWWVFMSILLIMPYWGSQSMNVAYVAWTQFFILGAPLIYGFIAYKYGNSVSEMGGYIPEYQERMANHLRVEKEIEIARESQFKLMPLRPPSAQGIDVYGFFMPSFEVGGDYFDYILGTNSTADSQVLNMTIADVSGKAMKAAMHAVFTSGLLLSRLHKDAPDSILREIAPTLHSRTDRQTFITCIIAQYHFENQILKLANAGHCLPILKRDGKAEFINTPAPKFPLGLRSTVDYQPYELQMQQGDFLLLYSDGLPEAVNPQGERFGFESLLRLVEELDTQQRPSNEIAMDIKRKVQKFSDYQLADDTTIICLKV
ncbi:PP2C family protein-serine/threonine phosphatase [Fodinibius sp. Rm-B-1B1-1]|uniref:PP2C family protein-serine/threonine phosphatase n=1 Tax=Fodinibius alkaliphilus TaxID=3140241 RepID=UPI00315A1921